MPSGIKKIIKLLIGVFFPFIVGAECRDVTAIRLFGNAITREEIIIRELTFKEGSIICDEKLSNELILCRQQLLNTQLFNEIIFRVDTTQPGELQVLIDIKERWYVWPIPKIEVADRNFNQWWLTKDPARINYGIVLVVKNVRGRNETLRLTLMNGYTKTAALDYYIPYINKGKTLGLGFGGEWMANREIWYKTRDDKVQFFHLDDDFAHQKWEVNARIVHRPHFYSTHQVGIRLGAGLIADTVLTPELNPAFFSSNSASQSYLGINYRFLANKVDFINYPTVGKIIEFQTEYFLNDNGKSPSITTVRLNYRRFWEVHKGIFAVAGIFGGLNHSKQLPYQLSRALGYRDFVRGFEYYVVDGSQFGLFKSNIKFRLFPQIDFQIPYLRTAKFKNVPINAYLGAFFDAGYVNGMQNLENNVLPNTAIYGTGLGLDITSYYDRVMRIEYSYNSLGRLGWYVHFRKAL